jgi:branched-chain amino acid transport system ATP-binding protein
VLLDGVELTGAAPEARARSGVIRSFQGARLFPRLTVAENIEAACVGQGMSRRKAARSAETLLHRFGLDQLARSRAESLTHGQQRLLGVVRGLAAQPKYLLLDEPAAGLNETETDELAALLRTLPTEFGLGLLIVEHDMRLIFGLCDRIHVLSEGRTIADGTPEFVREHPEVIRSYLGSAYEHRA